MIEEGFKSTGGTKIFVRTWLPENTARAIVVLVHGFKSHSGMFERAALELVRNRFAVSALDLRGHGRSEGERLFVGSFGDYVADVAGAVALAKARQRGVPVFVLGHSAGGVVACLYAIDHGTEIAGLVSESFAHELPAPDFALSVLKGIGKIAPHAHVLDLKSEDFSRDPGFVARMNADPLIPAFGYPAQTVAELVRADARLRVEFARITVPVLILHGTADKAAKPHGSQRFHQQVGSTDRTLTLYDGYFHDLLNDVGKERVMADITNWISARLPVPALAE
jgi:alpha-beta hydrolase superfamily lysophospholipase